MIYRNTFVILATRCDGLALLLLEQGRQAFDAGIMCACLDEIPHNPDGTDILKERVYRLLLGPGANRW